MSCGWPNKHGKAALKLATLASKINAVVGIWEWVFDVLKWNGEFSKTFLWNLFEANITPVSLEYNASWFKSNNFFKFNFDRNETLVYIRKIIIKWLYSILRELGYELVRYVIKKVP